MKPMIAPIYERGCDDTGMFRSFAQVFSGRFESSGVNLDRMLFLDELDALLHEFATEPRAANRKIR